MIVWEGKGLLWWRRRWTRLLASGANDAIQSLSPPCIPCLVAMFGLGGQPASRRDDERACSATVATTEVRASETVTSHLNKHRSSGGGLTKQESAAVCLSPGR